MNIADVEKVINNCAEAALNTDQILDLPFAHEPYYKFLYSLAKTFNFSDIIELGVYKGTGISHLAKGSGYYVTGVDIDLNNVKTQVMVDSNIDLIKKDSIAFLKAMLDNEVSFGLFHVDTKHEADQLKQELDQIFRVSQMAIICVDDININAEMKKLWSTALHKNAKKFEYPKLHATGYGVIFFNKEKNKNE